MTRDLTTGSVWKHIFNLAIPTFLGLAIQQIYSLVDTVIVGRILGENPLAGVGATGGLYFMIVYFCIGCCNGFGIPIAQEFGARNYQRMRKFFGNSILLCVGIGIIVIVAMCLLCDALIRLMNTPEEIYSYAYDYIFVIFLGLPCTFFYNILASAIRGLGDTRTPLAALIISSVVNIVLDYALMAIIPMGVAGAALATVISQGIAGVFCLIVLLKHFEIIKLKAEDLKPDATLIKRLSAMGFPMGLQCSITGIGTLVIQSAFNNLGAAAVTGMTVSLKVINLINTPIDGLGQIMAPYAGQNAGAGQYERIREGLFKAALAGFIWSVIEVPVILLFGKSSVYIFLTDPGEEIIGFAFTSMIWAVSFSILLTLVNTVRFTIQGMGYSAFAMIAGIMEMIGRVIAGWVFAPLWGYTGAAMGNALAWLLADLFLVPAFFICYKRTMKKAGN